MKLSNFLWKSTSIMNLGGIALVFFVAAPMELWFRFVTEQC